MLHLTSASDTGSLLLEENAHDSNNKIIIMELLKRNLLNITERCTLTISKLELIDSDKPMPFYGHFIG
jgi:hypothetical protein